MKANPDGSGGTAGRRKWPVWVMVLIVAGVMVLIGANAHMVYVSIMSQPECITHMKTPGESPGQYRAAKPAC